MRLLEHESKEILRRYNILIPEGDVVGSAEELKMDGPVMLKAQIPLGGRGKSGGVIEASSSGEAKDKIEQLLSTPIRGYRARRILVEEVIDIAQEFFMAVTYDTVAKDPLVIFSQEGGVDIEDLSATQPEKVQKELFTVRARLPQYRAREIISEAGISGRMLLGLGAILSSLADIFLDYDATVVEINPLVITTEGNLLAVDGKMVIDDNALFRHPDLADKRDLDVEAQAEIEARKYGLSFIKLDGDIGCMVNGAGLAMTTMDIIKLFGGDPANFLDIGGGASAEKVTAAFRIILSDPNIRAVLINIFGGITRGDTVARGILTALEEIKPDIPMVVRLIGTNAKEGRQILSDANMITADTLADAAQKAIAAAKGDTV